jgi:branched-chain amino acid transport system substrate-binding protein
MKHGKAAFILLAALLLASVLLAGCTQAPPKPAGEIKIGVIASLTGPVSNLGTGMWQSAILAADEINGAGGVYVKEFGRKVNITLIPGDDESTREGGQKAATKLITEDKVDVLVGGYSSAVTSAYQQTVAEYKIPFIVSGASSPIITHRTDVDTSTVFHHCPTTDAYGQYTTMFIDQVMRPAINAKFGFDESRPLRLALVYQDSPYGKGVQTAVNNTITAGNLKIELVSQQSFKMGESDFRTPLTAVKAAKPDAVYAAAFPNEMSQMVTQARRDVGLDTIFLAVETNDAPEYYKGIGQFGEYSIIESRFSPYTVPSGELAAAQKAFKDSYNARFGGYPDMMGASTHDSIHVAAQAVENAGTVNKTAVVAALGTLKMPQRLEAMKDGFISFTPDFREAQFDLWMEQLYYDPSLGETRPRIVWPDSLKVTDFVLPDWYQPGSS